MLVFKVRPRKSPTATAALTPSERRMMRVIGDAMLKVRRQVIRDETEILYAIEHGTPGKVSSLISVDPWLEIQETIQEELFAELVSGGQRVKLPTIRKEVLTYRFDATRPEAANWAAKEAGTLIREIGDEQVTLVRDYVSRASMGEYTPRQVARNLRDVIGLTSAQAGWVENFRSRQISEQMARGKSYDQAYADSEKATERYHARIHRYRTETIARTEILRASHEGRREGWRQGIEEGYISAGASKQWSTELDGRECEICAPLDGETVLLDAEFSDGEPPIHPNCRCDVLLVDDVDADLEGLTSEELDAIIEDLLDPTTTVPSTVIAQPQVSIEDSVNRAKETGEPITAAESLRAEISQIADEYGKKLAEGNGDLDGYLARVNPLIADHLEQIQPTMSGTDFNNYALALKSRMDSDYSSSYQRWNLDSEERDSLTSYVQTVHREGSMMIAVPYSAIDSVLEDGRIKTQFESGTSGGTFSHQTRSVAETAMFGIHPEVNPSTRPVYGYVSVSTKTPGAVEHYGRVRFELKNTVRERATITVGDSLGKNPIPIPLAPSTNVTEEKVFAAVGYTRLDRLLSPSSGSFEEKSQEFENKDGYIEMQVKGGVSLSDIATAHVPVDDVFNDQAGRIEAAGIKVIRY